MVAKCHDRVWICHDGARTKPRRINPSAIAVTYSCENRTSARAKENRPAPPEPHLCREREVACSCHRTACAAMIFSDNVIGPPARPSPGDLGAGPPGRCPHSVPGCRVTACGCSAPTLRPRWSAGAETFVREDHRCACVPMARARDLSLGDIGRLGGAGRFSFCSPDVRFSQRIRHGDGRG